MPRLDLTPTVIVQSPQKFEETVKAFKEVCPFPHYNIRDGVVSRGGKVTRYGNTCAELALSNGKDTALYHLAPENSRINTNEKIDEAIRRFKDKGEEFYAFITGGYSRFTPPNQKQALESFEQLVDIGNVVARHTDNITMVAGKLNNGFTDNLAVNGDTFFLSHNRKLGSRYLPELKSSQDAGEVFDILSKDYEIVDIDGPRVIIDV